MDGISVLKKEVKKACSSTSATLKHIQKVPYVRKGAQHMAIHGLCVCEISLQGKTPIVEICEQKMCSLRVAEPGKFTKSQKSLSVKVSLQKAF